MTNEQIISKMKDDMKMRGFSHWTEESYLGKTKDIMKYFRKPMEEVEIEELRNNKKQLPMYRKRRKMKDVLTKEELSTFFNACENYMKRRVKHFF